MVAQEVYSVGVLDALGKPLSRATSISRGIIPLVEKIPKEDRQIRLFAANSSLYPVEVVCLVNIRDDDNLFASLHARVMGAPPVGRKLETSSCTFGNSYDDAERILGAVDSRSADQRMYLALGNGTQK